MRAIVHENEALISQPFSERDVISIYLFEVLEQMVSWKLSTKIFLLINPMRRKMHGGYRVLQP